MILEMNRDDFRSLVRGCAPGNLRLADTPVASREVLEMLAELSESVSTTFTPTSWLIVAEDEIVGLCSVTRHPKDGVVDIGYGIAPSRQGKGHASAALCELVIWAREAPHVHALSAETSTSNTASQRVLKNAGFRRTGERIDEEDGPLIQWLCETT